MTAPVWTLERIDELKRLRRAGAAYWRIAKRLGVTREAAVEKAMSLGLRPVARARVPEAQGEPAALGALREILEPGLCHWIAGDVGPRAWRMCGHRCVHGSSWCAHHLERAHGRIAAVAPGREEVA